MKEIENNYSNPDHDFIQEKVDYWTFELEIITRRKDYAERQLGMWGSALAFRNSVPLEEPEYIYPKPLTETRDDQDCCHEDQDE